jgi:hypothetical protein
MSKAHPPKWLREFLTHPEAQGWAAEIGTRNIKLNHPHARHPVWAAKTPSDYRNHQNLLSHMRRALKGAEYG